MLPTQIDPSAPTMVVSFSVIHEMTAFLFNVLIHLLIYLLLYFINLCIIFMLHDSEMLCTSKLFILFLYLFY